MKFKLRLLILLLLTFSMTTLSQTKTLQGEWSFLTLKENQENITIPESSQVRYFKFAEDELFFSSITCNNISGKYLLGTKGKIKFNFLRTTLMGCADEKLKVEQSFARVLSKITKYQIKGNVLTLRDEKGINLVTLTKYSEPK